FLGLALLVPMIEESFLRAFLMRYVMHENWTEIPFGVVNRMAVAVGILLPVLYHPEHLAALVWFSLVTWLMVRTKNYWDCVAAHATTNLLLGIYVVVAGAWLLWDRGWGGGRPLGGARRVCAGGTRFVVWRAVALVV